MLTFDAERQREYRQVLADRNEVLREQMFGANGIRPMVAMPEQGTRDAAALAEFTRRMTEYVDNELDRMDYPETTYRQVFTLRTNIPRGADAYVKHEIEANGQDDWIDEEADNTPMLAVGTIPNTRPLLPRGMAYRITNTEVLRATQARMPIDMDKPTEARRIVEEGLDRVYWLGDAVTNIYGILTHPNIPSGAAVTGTWSSATAAQIEADILDVLNTRIGATQMVRGVWDFALPNSQFLKITQTRLGDYHSETIASWLISRIPQLRQFVAADRLNGAGTAGADLGVLVPVGARFGYGLQPGDVQTEGPHQVSMHGNDYLVSAKTGGFFTTKPLMFEIVSGI